MQTSVKPEPNLIIALHQSARVIDKVQECAQELSLVNTVLKEELAPHSLEEIKSALTQSEQIEDKVQECADDLHRVNAVLTQEITERKKLEQQLLDTEAQEEKNRYLAYHDTVTGLANRALFNDRIEQALAQAERHKRSFAVMFIDLDKFKSINDTYGHAIGDKVLQVVATRLQNCVRDEDTVSRPGGDEFLCLLMEVKEESDIAGVADSMIRGVAEACEFNDVKVSTKASIGIAIYPQDGTTAEALLKNADAAMYKAKQEGEGYFFFNRMVGA